MFNSNFKKHSKFLCEKFNKYLYIYEKPNRNFKNQFCNNCNILSCKFRKIKMRKNNKYCPILKSHKCIHLDYKNCSYCQLFIEIAIKPHIKRYKINSSE